MSSDEFIQRLIAELGERQSLLQTSAHEKLIGIGTRAVPYLIEALGNSDDEILSANAAYILGEIDDKRALASLLTAATDKPGVVRLYSVIAVGKLGNSSIAEALLNVLHESAGTEREQTLYSLIDIGAMTIGDQRIINAVIEALKDDDLNVREAAATALGSSKNSKAIPPLIGALKDDSQEVQIQAAIALPKFGELAVAAIAQTLERGDIQAKLNAITALSRMGSEGVMAFDTLVELLEYPHATVRVRAATALVSVGGGEARQPLQRYIGSETDEAVREEVTKILKRLDH